MILSLIEEAIKGQTHFITYLCVCVKFLKQHGIWMGSGYACSDFQYSVSKELLLYNRSLYLGF